MQLLYRTKDTDFTPCDENAPVRAMAEESPLDGTAARLTVAWRNAGTEPVACQLEIRVKTDFAFTHYLIPAVNYNGNGWGRGDEPKGLARDGQPWVFDHRRTAIPACTISENRERFFALFASDESAASLNASCSMIPCEDGTMLHRLLYPCIETPGTYRGRDAFAEAHEDFLTLSPGETYRTTAFVLRGAPVKENFAAAQVEDAALELLSVSAFPPRYTPAETERLCCAFSQSLLEEKDGVPLLCTGSLPDSGNGFAHRVDYEFGWCGQNGLYARLMIEYGEETGDVSLIETGEKILDFWAGSAGKTGLVYTNYNAARAPSRRADTCNLSYVISELALAYRYLKNRGRDKPLWLSAARRAADFLTERYDEEWGFGKVWDVETGECLDRGGTIGAFLVPALCDLYAVTGEKTYLTFAKKACRFYRDRDLVRFECTAGALDTCCIDKETSAPLLIGGLALYGIDPSEEWLDCAKMAGWYFCSWMFHHDTLPVPGSDFEQYGIRTLGATSVSTQHHHLDPWGARVVPELLTLWRVTGDDRWKQRADLLWANVIQNIAPAEGKLVHGRFRPAGAQNEGYFHCHWGHPDAPGSFNDWLVAWPQAFCWETARKLQELQIEKIV